MSPHFPLRFLPTSTLQHNAPSSPNPSPLPFFLPEHCPKRHSRRNHDSTPPQPHYCPPPCHNLANVAVLRDQDRTRTQEQGQGTLHCNEPRARVPSSQTTSQSGPPHTCMHAMRLLTAKTIRQRYPHPVPNATRSPPRKMESSGRLREGGNGACARRPCFEKDARGRREVRPGAQEWLRRQGCGCRRAALTGQNAGVRACHCRAATGAAGSA